MVSLLPLCCILRCVPNHCCLANALIVQKDISFQSNSSNFFLEKSCASMVTHLKGISALEAYPSTCISPNWRAGNSPTEFFGSELVPSEVSDVSRKAKAQSSSNP